jgi:arylsulfatase A-like enzyme
VSDSRPNLLWYCSDQQRFDTIGALGNPHVHTPNLDRLAANGVAFEHAYCQAPICTPSRASFLTGRYPSTVHANTNGNEAYAGERLVTRRLADAGYDCGLVGKLHLAGAANGRETRTDDGYGYFQYSHAPRDNWFRGHDYAEWLREQGEDPAKVLWIKSNLAGDLMEPTPARDNVPPHLHQTRWCSEKAIEFVSEQRERPWLISVNPYDPHPPYNPPYGYYRRFDPDALPGPYFRESDLAHQNEKLGRVDFQSRSRRPEDFEAKKVQAAYYAMIEQVDHEFGRVLDALERTGQAENTVVVFMSDHGEALGDHGLVHKGCRFFDGLVRVPLIVSRPGHFEGGLRSSALVELTDVMPTLMELAGLPVPAGTQGRSLVPILTGQAPPDRHRDFVRCEYYDAVDLPDRTWGTMYRDRRWKLNVYHDHGTGELYDMERDPLEFDDLWDSPEHQSVKCDLLRRSFDATVRAIDYGPARVMPY